MKTIMQYIVILLTSLSCFALFSCHDENDIFSNEIGSTLEHFDGKRVSTFYLPHDSTTISNGTNSATVYLENTETLKQYEFSAKTILKDTRLEVKMDIPNNEKIDDGIYNLSVVVITNLDIILMRIRFIVKIRKEMIDIIDAKIPEYKYLSGSGTNKNPYLISSTKDFDYLLYNLKYVDTELHGKGSYFSQTADFDAPKAGDDADGREYASFPFAGIYKGNGHTISNLDTSVASNKTGGGLFGYVFGNAVIENVGFLDLNISNSSGIAYESYVPVPRPSGKDNNGLRTDNTFYHDIYVKLSTDTVNPKGAILNKCSSNMGLIRFENIIVDGTGVKRGTEKSGGILMNQGVTLCAQPISTRFSSRDVYVISDQYPACFDGSATVHGFNQANGTALDGQTSGGDAWKVEYKDNVYSSKFAFYSNIEQMIEDKNSYETFTSISWAVTDYPMFKTAAGVFASLNGEIALDNTISLNSTENARKLSLVTLSGDTAKINQIVLKSFILMILS